MIFLSVKDNAILCEKIKEYCSERWRQVFSRFADIADESLHANGLPQTWVIMEHRSIEGIPGIIGFYQLTSQDGLTVHAELTPFIASLFIEPDYRGGKGYGEAALNHARSVLGEMGYDMAYLSTDHIGYYEKYGFNEIGLDVTDYGRPGKVYSFDTITGIRYEAYDRLHPKPDHIRLAIYGLQNPLPKNTAALMWFLKHRAITEPDDAKWFSIAAFDCERLIGAVNFMQNEKDPLNWYIGDLAVAEDHRRRGIASKMLRKGMERISQMANGSEFIYAYIEKGNTASKALHSKLGFLDTGERKPFGELLFGDDETTWVKRL